MTSPDASLVKTVILGLLSIQKEKFQLAISSAYSVVFALLVLVGNSVGDSDTQWVNIKL